MITNNSFYFLKEKTEEYTFIKDKKISIISLNYKRNFLEWEIVINNAIPIFFEYINTIKTNKKIYFWCKSDEFYNASALKRFKGVWNDQRLNFLQKSDLYSYVHSFETKESYTIIKKINQTSFSSELFNYIRLNNNCFVFLDNLNDNELINCDNYFFENYKDLSKIVDWIEKRDGILLKPFGNFDDNIFGIDFIGNNLNINY